MNRSLAITAVLAVALATSVGCSRTQKTFAGAGIGGATGAIAGNAIAGSGGAVVGAVGGGTVGAIVGNRY